MLPPEYLEDMPDEIVELYAQAERDILADMARRINQYDYWISAADWQNQKLLEAGRTQSEILNILAKATKRSVPELKKLMEQAAKDNLKTDISTYEAAGKVVPTFEDSAALREILTAGYKATAQTMKNLTQTTARTATQQFERALDKAWMKVTSGAFDSDAAINSAIKELCAQGVKSVRYPSGHEDTLEVAVRRAVLTGVNKTCCEMSMALIEEFDCDLVEVSAHAGARTGEGVANHAEWQGKVYRLNRGMPSNAERDGEDILSTKENHGERDYPDFVENTGYGTGEGLGGWNCRHSFGPYFEGMPRTWSDEELQKLKEPRYTYNGKKLTEEEARARQRYIERQIRRWKRENMAMQAAGKDTTQSAAKLKQWQERQEDFLKQTGLKRSSSRDHVEGFGYEEATKAAADASKYEKELAEKQQYGKIISEIRDSGAIPKSAKIHIPSTPIDSQSLGFDDAHINDERSHGVTMEQAKSWINSASVSATVWKGRYERYYHHEGAVYVDMEEKFIRTAYPIDEFDDKTKKLMEVLEKYGY
jgi:hypothetical protein